MSYITAHVLDASAGRPAEGISVRLFDAAGTQIAEAITNSDGRVQELGPEHLDPAEYRITFETGSYFADRQIPTFYPRVQVEFTVEAGQKHYHVPLLLSPFAYSTYRGS